MNEELNKASLKLFKTIKFPKQTGKKITQKAIPMMIPNCVFVSIRQEIIKLNFNMTISFKLFLIRSNITSMERIIVLQSPKHGLSFHIYMFVLSLCSWKSKRKVSKNLYSNKQRI